MRDWVLLLIVVASAANGAMAAEAAPDFASGGRPFLEKYCLDCHSGDEPEAGVSFDKFHDSNSVMREWNTLEMAIDMIAVGAMPPEDLPKPSVEDAEAFSTHVRSIYDYAARHAKPNPGRVTMRRLNRTEYENTIRDLMGVEFDAGSFPSDPIGYGFDNIGDVLSLSPLLMERYLDAAETIVQQAIVPNPPPPPKRSQFGMYLEPASSNAPKEIKSGRWRRMVSDSEDYLETGPLNTPYKWVEGGEYIFRTRVYAPRHGDQPVRIAVMVHGAEMADASSDAELTKIVGKGLGKVMQPAKILKIFEVKADTKEDAEVLECRVPAIDGRHRMMLGMVKAGEGQPPETVWTEYLALEGPLDTRPASQLRLLACSPNKPQAEQTREVLTRFMGRAYRRTATPEEIEHVASLVEAVVAEGGKWEEGMQFAFQAALCSPKFLFRAELDDRPRGAAPEPISEYQLASRLSYFLWSTMPDEELFALAAKNQLTANLDAQVRRMLADPKADALVNDFAVQWLQIGRIEWIAPDGGLFPTFDDELRAAMLIETKMFFDSVMREDRSIIDLIDADYTFLNEPLAKHYGIADTEGNHVGEPAEVQGGKPIQGEAFVRVAMHDGSRRGGLLTQASVLTVTSNPTRTSPVQRGQWVLEQILGEPPPPPPADVPELPEGEIAAADASLRERLEIHRRDPKCANCHAKMDAIGFSLENFNAVGGFRTKDGPFEIDSSGEFPSGLRFDDAQDLKSLIKTEMKEQFVRCLTEKMLIYALGRGLQYYDRPAVDKIVAALAANDYKFSVLVTEIVNSKPFRLRRGLSE